MLAVGDHRALEAAVLALKAANRDLRSRINKATRAELAPIWKQEVESQLMGRDHLTTRLLAGVRVQAGNPPRAMAAQSVRPIGRKALVPSRDYFIGEFGLDRDAIATYDRKNRKGGGRHKVTRHVNRGKPARRQSGRVAYPAFAETAPRMVSLWVQTIVKLYNDAAEGKV